MSQYAVLSNLATCATPGGPTVGVLSDLLGLDRTTLTHNLRPLERAGLVALAPDPGDRRLRRVALTPAGRAKRDRCVPLWRAAQDRFDQVFGAEPSRALRASLLVVAGRAEPAAAVSEGD